MRAGEGTNSGKGRRLLYAGLGLVVAIVAARAFAATASSVPSGPLRDLGAYLATWVPMVAAVVIACAGAGWTGTRSLLGLEIHGIDVLWAIAAGFLARAVDATVNLQLSGTTGLAPLPSIGGSVDGWLIVTGILAPVVIAPIIEETLFRGLLQPSLVGVLSRRLPRVVAAAIGVVVTALVFSLVHLAVGDGTVTAMLVTAIGTFTLGLAAGAIAASTGRIGGAILAHMIFNGIAVALTWPH